MWRNFIFAHIARISVSVIPTRRLPSFAPIYCHSLRHLILLLPLMNALSVGTHGNCCIITARSLCMEMRMVMTRKRTRSVVDGMGSSFGIITEYECTS